MTLIEALKTGKRIRRTSRTSNRVMETFFNPHENFYVFNLEDILAIDWEIEMESVSDQKQKLSDIKSRYNSKETETLDNIFSRPATLKDIDWLIEQLEIAWGQKEEPKKKVKRWLWAYKMETRYGLELTSFLSDEEVKKCSYENPIKLPWSEMEFEE